MADLLTIALPFFALLALGYGAGRYGAIPAGGRASIEFFAVRIALPTLFFRLVAVTAYADRPDWSFVLTATFATYCTFALAFSFAALVNRGHIAEATVIGLAGSSSGIALLAPGLVVAAFGPQAGAAMAFVFAADLILLAALAPLMMMLGGTERGDWRHVLQGIALAILRNPLFVATVLGLVAALVHLRLPGPLDRLLIVLGAAAAPAALFAFGLDLAGRPFGGRGGYGLAIALPAQLVVHPLIVYLLLGWIDGFPAAWIDAALVMAALPTAAGVIDAARRFAAGETTAERIVLYSALAAAATLLLVLALIGDGVLPAAPFR